MPCMNCHKHWESPCIECPEPATCFNCGEDYYGEYCECEEEGYYEKEVVK